MKSHRAGGPESGMTLVELLVAMTLMSVIALALAGGIRFGVRAWETAEQNWETGHHVQTVQAWLRDQVSRAQPPAGVRLDKTAPAFAGARDRLEFLARMTLFNRPTDDGASEVVLSLQPAASGFDDPAAVFDLDAVIVPAPAAVRLQYGSRPADGPDIEWTDDWTEAARLPAFVRIEADRDQGSWPPLVIKLWREVR